MPSPGFEPRPTAQQSALFVFPILMLTPQFTIRWSRRRFYSVVTNIVIHTTNLTLKIEKRTKQYKTIEKQECSDAARQAWRTNDTRAIDGMR
ncbi:hypothetical protein TNCV_3749341 [Trichonephila clavipes]|nr:hypothetical protein TNCV_3749341 [Trichonephila clavipes]